MLLPLTQLHPHPLNANVMHDSTLAKLIAHIRATGLYPPLIVRERADGDGYQLLDGHHRLLALQQLGHAEARCEVWANVDDVHAAMLLATLNRLHGEDDPHLRGELLAELSRAIPRDELEALLPDDAERLERLIELAGDAPPPPPADEAELPALPRALTFFLDAATHERVIAQLDAIDGDDRNLALVSALGLPLVEKGAADERR